MTYNPKYNEQNYKYRSEKFKRVGIDFDKSKYEQIKAHAVERSETVNGFIKRAIDETMQRDNEDNPE